MVTLPWLLVVAAAKTDLPYRDPLALVRFDVDSRRFDSRAMGGSVWGHSEPPGPRQTEARDALRQAMRRYPPGMITRHLRFVYTTRRLFQDGEELLGVYVYIPPGICLAMGAPAESFNPRELRSTFHHEFAHAIYTQRPGFPRKEWDAQNERGYEYGSWPQNEARDEFALSDALARAGFVNAYAASDHAEDFAEVAERVMGNDADFWRACRKYPRLAAKARLVETFYRRIHPGFRVAHGPADLFPRG